MVPSQRGPTSLSRVGVDGAPRCVQDAGVALTDFLRTRVHVEIYDCG